MKITCENVNISFDFYGKSVFYSAIERINMFELTLPGLLDGILHVLFAIIATIIIYPYWKEHKEKIVLAAVIMELIIDGAHLVNKNYTHNLFFLIEMPLAIVFAGIMIKSRNLIDTGVIILASTWTHLIMDLYYEGDTLALYYPVYATEFSANHAGFIYGLAIWLIVLIPIAIAMRVWTKHAIPPLSLPPYPSGR